MIANLASCGRPQFVLQETLFAFRKDAGIPLFGRYFSALGVLTKIPQILYIHMASSSSSTRELEICSPIIPGKAATK